MLFGYHKYKLKIWLYNLLHQMETGMLILFFVLCAGILKLFQSDLLECRSLEDLGQFLGKLPTVDSDIFFPQIESVHFTAKKFKHILLQGQRKPASDSSTTQDY